MRRAKIVCTLGPALDTPERMAAVIEAGMDVARLNMSHGDQADHLRRYNLVRKASDAAGHAVAILADLQGPKIRLGRFTDGPHLLAVGDSFTITTEDVPGTKEICSTTYKGLAGDVAPGDPLLIDDGRVGLEVVAVDGPRVHTKVVVPGPVSNNKGINLPGVAVSVPALSDKDADDLRWALKTGVDFIALSFVRSGADIVDVHAIMDEVGVRRPVIAKVEKPQAVDDLEGIVAAFDGVMVARGDLGVELPLEQVPIVQKRAVELCRRNAKPVIVATQMLESMISAPRPTRAEASDVANAVLDGADALMLSGETSVGEFAIETVQTMARIIANTEKEALDRIRPLGTTPHTQGGAVTWAARAIAENIGASQLVTFTVSGDSARRMARLRSPIPALAFTPDAATRNQLALTWGTEPFLVPFVDTTDDMVAQVDKALLDIHRVENGSTVVIVAGSLPGKVGSTNAIRVHRVGDAKNQ
ncbi:pyruvate kinase [Quadrisphaera sp. RL12-1S]|uniref:pyruvate kinase n=2 Tax=Quadrisphaera TaxID=317661 RepID=UPI001647932E|nr:pyruvate kinase [Quadrisphaera sp. RL12-1S]MBC3762090.1 pyruvate kinase [Quadrisphaera sp. RL12-1S]